MGPHLSFLLVYSKVQETDILRPVNRFSEGDKKLMNVVAATKDFETWAGRHIPLVRAQLSEKHRLMAESLVPYGPEIRTLRLCGR